MRKALRVWRDDIYAAQSAIAQALITDSWWVDMPEPLTQRDDIGMAAAQLSADAWEAAAGSRRRFIELQNLQRSGAALPVDELRTTFKIMEIARSHIAKQEGGKSFYAHRRAGELTQLGMDVKIPHGME